MNHPQTTNIVQKEIKTSTEVIDLEQCKLKAQW